MPVITTIRGGAVLTLASLETLRGDRRWILDSDAGVPLLPDDVPRLAGDEATDAGPIRHFAESRLIADAAAAALADAGLTRADLAGPDTGFVSGSCYGCGTFLDGIRAGLAQNGPRGVRATEFSIATHGYPMAALAMSYGAQGPATAFVGDAGSAVEALAFADLMLRLGFCERMVVLGYDLPGPVAQAHLAVTRRLTSLPAIVALVVERAALETTATDAPVLTASVTPAASAAALPPPCALAASPLLEIFAQLRGKPAPTPFTLEIVESCGSRTRLQVGPLKGVLAASAGGGAVARPSPSRPLDLELA